jgi:hypothetical protein
MAATSISREILRNRSRLNKGNLDSRMSRGDFEKKIMESLVATGPFATPSSSARSSLHWSPLRSVRSLGKRFAKIIYIHRLCALAYKGNRNLFEIASRMSISSQKRA